MPHRRDLFRLGAIALGNLFALALAVPGVKFLLDPLGKTGGVGDFQPLTPAWWAQGGRAPGVRDPR